MTQVPEMLFRAVDQTALVNHHRGLLWFRSHTWFRQKEDGDPLEGLGGFKIKGQVPNRNVFDQSPFRPAYFMSFSEDIEGTQAQGRKNYPVLQLNEPEEFRDLIKKHLPSDCIAINWIKIDYCKTWEVDEDPGAGYFHRQYCCKPARFADEREWRLQIRFKFDFPIQNDTLKFDWRERLGVFFRPVPKGQLPNQQPVVV